LYKNVSHGGIVYFNNKIVGFNCMSNVLCYI